MVEIKELDKIINNTLVALEEGRKQVYDIAESTRQEYQHICQELEEAKEEALKTIRRVNWIEKQLKSQGNFQLAEVNAYYEARAARQEMHKYQNLCKELNNRGKMALLKQQYLKRKAEELREIMQKAENLLSHFSVISDYFNPNLQPVSGQINNLQQTYQMSPNIIKAQEEERKRVAREIHDGPAQLLANIVMRAEFCLKLLDMDPAKIRNELKELQNLVRQSLQEVRKVIFDLRPMVLDDLGLIAALKRYLIKYKEQYNIETELVCTGPCERLPAATEVTIFRIIQECLNNIQKHSGAKHATVKIEINDKEINATVRDDGKGFEIQSVSSNRDSYGLISMRERAALLKGKITVHSTPGRGTTVDLSLPVSKCS